MSMRNRLRGSFYAVATVLCVAGLACRQDPAALAAGFVASGDEYMQKEQFKAAILEYRNALEHQPSVADIHRKLAAAYDKAGDPQKALASLVRVTQLDQDDVEANFRVSQALLAMGRFAETRELAERVLRRDARHVGALTVLAGALAGTGYMKIAQDKLAEALSIDPRYEFAHLTRASWQIRDRKPGDATATLRKLLEYHPRSVDAWVALGTLQWRTRADAAAEQSLKRALDLSAGSVHVHRLLGTFYVEKRRVAEAEPHLRAATASSAADRLRLADYYVAAGRTVDAERELDELVRKKDVGATARLRRAGIRYADGRKTEAYEDLDAAIQDRNVGVDARLAKAQYLAADGQLEAALDEARTVVSAEPQRADAAYALALIHVQRNNLDEAETWLARTRGLTKTPAPIDFQRARVALAAGRSDDAAKLARHAANAIPSPETYALLARALSASGDDTKAAARLAEARRRWPDATILTQTAAQLHLAAGRTGHALKEYERAAKRGTGRAGALTAVGMLKQEKGDAAGARAAYEAALAIDKRNGVAANNLAWIYADSGRLDEALALAKIAHESLNGAPQALDTLGWMYHLKGATADAVPLLKAALEKAPENPVYQEHLKAALK